MDAMVTLQHRLRAVLKERMTTPGSAQKNSLVSPS